VTDSIETVQGRAFSPLAYARTCLIALFMSLNQCERNDGEFALWANQRPRLLVPNAEGRSGSSRKGEPILSSILDYALNGFPA
jgi:hypothetical protein